MKKILATAAFVTAVICAQAQTAAQAATAPAAVCARCGADAERKMHAEDCADDAWVEDDTASAARNVLGLRIDEEKLARVLRWMPDVTGYIQAGYDYNSLGAKPRSTFVIQRAELDLRGEPVKRLHWRLQVQCFSGAVGARRENGRRVMELYDAWMQWEFSPAAQLRVGQTSTPLGFEGDDIGPTTLETANYSLLYSRLVCRDPVAQDATDTGRALGLFYLGHAGRWSWKAAVTNGAVQSTDDTDRWKDLTASLTYAPAEGLRVQASYCFGRGRLDTAPEAGPVNVSRAVAGVWYMPSATSGPDLRAEWGLERGSRHGVSYVKETGGYVLAAWRLKRGWAPVVRWDMWHNSVLRTAPSANLQRVLAGVTWQPVKPLKLQANVLLDIVERSARAANAGHACAAQATVMALVMF